MELFTSTTAIETLGILFCLFALLFILISFVPSLRSHTVKLSSLLFVISLALFANNFWVYIFAVFIVATSLTKLEFLQNIAAIFRGSKEYFDYQKEHLNREEIEEKINSEEKVMQLISEDKKEIVEEIKLSFDPQDLHGKNLRFVGEQLTLNYLESEFKKPIEKNVRYVGDNSRVEIDGVISGDFKTKDIIFDVKVLSKLSPVLSKYLIKGAFRTFTRFIDITGRKAEFWIIFATQNIVEEKEKILKILHYQLSKSFLNVQTRFLIFDEIGLPYKNSE